MPRNFIALGLTAITAAITAAGCYSPLDGGMAAFHHADYPRAARELRGAATEGMPAEDSPRYDLYSGLTHLALGDAASAVVHLSRARLTLDRKPTYFTRGERARLLSAWRSLGKMPGQDLAM